MDRELLIKNIMRNKSLIIFENKYVRMEEYLDLDEDTVWMRLKKLDYNFYERQRIMDMYRKLVQFYNRVKLMPMHELEELGEELGLCKIKERQKRLGEFK